MSLLQGDEVPLMLFFQEAKQIHRQKVMSVRRCVELLAAMSCRTGAPNLKELSAEELLAEDEDAEDSSVFKGVIQGLCWGYVGVIWVLTHFKDCSTLILDTGSL